MTTLADIRRIFSVRGIDPDRLSQAPGRNNNDGRFLFRAPIGARVWFAPHEQDGQRTGWAYTAYNRHDGLTDAGHTDTTAPEGLLPVLHRHQKQATAPASPRRRDALLALGNPAAHTQLRLRADSPAHRWILGLFVTWTQLQDEDDGSVNGGDLVTHLGQAFAEIGLTEQLDLDELADRVDPGPRPGDADPAAPMTATSLEQALDQALQKNLVRALDRRPAVLTLHSIASEMVAQLRAAGLLDVVRT
ncbi:hypothetical protein [Pseudonocardia parietis]|uniref:DUF4102 domain-containing protein n=1 Tax=Pseudonocardia parietis TaxID=570936 RepID=A0ABS4W641_9PSEU|nr:hypothetical protein [Pseudonocardia parietis]MBP2371675.1 hypothetical protein [Pseudonocardia parietis]